MVIFDEPIYCLYAKGNLYFRKNILTSNFIPASFDELKHISQRAILCRHFSCGLGKSIQFSHGMSFVSALLIIKLIEVRKIWAYK